MRFSFIGELGFPKKEEKAFAEGKTKNKDPYFRVNPMVIAAKNNTAFCEAFGIKSDPIKTYDSDWNEIEIEYEDADDKDAIEKVAFSRKHIISLDERFETASDYNFCKKIWEDKDEFAGKRVLVTGDVKKNIYNGKISNRFELSNIYALKEEDDRKNGLEITAEFFWTKDGIDTSDFKKEKKIYIDGYTREYVSSKDKIKKSDPDNMYFEQRIVFDCHKIDFENEKHLKLLAYRLKHIGLKYEDGKIECTLKKGKVYQTELLLTYSRGAEEVDFDESQLTKEQLEAIEFGLNTIDDFRPKGKSYGESKIEYKYNKPTLKGKYKEGMLCELKWDDFEDEIYMPKASKEDEEEFEKAMNAPEEKEEEKKTDDDDELDDDELDGLFD